MEWLTPQLAVQLVLLIAGVAVSHAVLKSDTKEAMRRADVANSRLDKQRTDLTTTQIAFGKVETVVEAQTKAVDALAAEVREMRDLLMSMGSSGETD